MITIAEAKKVIEELERWTTEKLGRWKGMQYDDLVHNRTKLVVIQEIEHILSQIKPCVDMMEQLEKSVRETLAKYPLWPWAMRMALEKEVLGGE